MSYKYTDMTLDMLKIESEPHGRVLVSAPTGEHTIPVLVNNEDIPTVALELLKAAGWEPSGWVETYAVPPFKAESKVQDAVNNLRRAQRIREGHAKPKVTDEDLVKVGAMVSERLRDGAVNDLHVVRCALQAALDSGVVKLVGDD